MTASFQRNALDSVKVIAGPNVPDREDTLQNYRRMTRLLSEMNRLRPYQKPRGIYRFRTWEQHDEFVRTRAARRL